MCPVPDRKSNVVKVARERTSRRASQKSSGKDRDFGAKVDAIEEVIGHLYPSSHFSHKTLASILEVNTSRVSEMRKGVAPVHPHQIAKLFNHFGLTARDFPPELLRCPLDEVRAALRQCEIGLYGGSNIAQARRFLFNATRTRRDAPKRIIIEFNHIPVKSYGGLGPPPLKRNGALTVLQGSQISLTIRCPERGSLIVLSEEVGGHILSLRPSVFAPGTAVDGAKVVLPADNAELSAFDAGDVPGLYRIYAIWSRVTFPAPWAERDTGEDNLVALTELEFSNLVLRTREISEEVQDAVALAKLEYRVR
jgi:hypothetical protein